MCGKTPSSMPVRNTTGNSRPLAVWSVIRVMTPEPSSSSSGIWSESATRATCSRNSASVPARPPRLRPPALLLELQGHGGQFLEVLDAGLVLRVGGCLQLGEVAGPFEDRFQDDGGARRPSRRSCGAPPSASLKRLTALAERAAMPYASSTRRSACGEGDLLAQRQGVDHRFGAVADAALGHVEDAAQRDGVLGVGQDPQIGQDVPDLLALVEADAADDLVGQADPDEDLLEDAGLRVGAVEDRDVARPWPRPRR